jgi:hypothetical protein
MEAVLRLAAEAAQRRQDDALSHHKNTADRQLPNSSEEELHA